MSVANYVAELRRLYATGQTTEHSFRPALARLFDSISRDVRCINEPPAITKVGRPDFVFLRKVGSQDITVGHCEAKDIGIDIRPSQLDAINRAQHDRYAQALPNLVYTNGLDFAFYKNGERVREIKIGEPIMGIQPLPEAYEPLVNQLRDFCAERLQTINSAETLAEMMAGKAVLIKDVLYKTLLDDKKLTSELASQLKAFQDQLIHDLSQQDFADIYAETIAYGMFAARLHDDTLDDFSRAEALSLLPKSNPFLRKLFEFVAGPSLPSGISKTVDELAEVFQAIDLQKLFANFGNFTQRNDPFIHFYETFLAKYNPAKRKARGVWYTPEPVVNFIVRAVDDVLKSEFGLSHGLADTSKVTIDWDTGQSRLTAKGKAFKSGERQIEKKEVHRVQILDPAAGTGTFLAEVIRQIGERVKGVAPGKWSTYVETELIPRLHGFELLMASYAMCHMKLDMMLTSMGYKPSAEHPPRLGIYLTNSLEEGEHVNQTLPFAQWLSNEAREANTVKNDVPVMVVIGNPPYSGISQNMGEWIVNLIDQYKYVDGEHFGERKHWLHDDYVKFIRLAEHMIGKTGEGVLGLITNHGYLDNPTFRGMRLHLLNTFDKIWVIDLHGNTKKKEVSPDGTVDQNVFDIQQGVALIIAIKKRNSEGKAKPLAEVKRGDLWGRREVKYETLWRGSLSDTIQSELRPQKKYFMFYNANLRSLGRFDEGFGVNELFKSQSTGIISARDGFVVDFERGALIKRLDEFASSDLSDAEARARFFGLKKAGKYLPGDSRGWKLSEKRPLLRLRDNARNVRAILYRPFDVRHIAYDQDLVDWPRIETMGEFNAGENIALLSPRMTADDFSPLVTDKIISNKTASRYDQSYFFPLYIYPAKDSLDRARSINMEGKISARIKEVATSRDGRQPDELAIFDYVYGVLHCPSYRETYREFLAIDFPRIPYPPSPEVFRDVSAKGTQLRCLHLMQDQAIGATPYPFKGDGDSIVDEVRFKESAVFINETQRFEGVPESAWSFVVGGYQPAQKWLKDRKGRTLSFEDVLHYQKIIKVLSETDRIMNTIEMPL